MQRMPSYIVAVASILRVVLAVDHATLPKAVLGGFFDEDASMRAAFTLAVSTVNECARDNEICETMHESEVDVNARLFHQVEIVPMPVLVDQDDLIDIHDKFEEIASGSRNSNNNRHPSSNQFGLTSVIGPHERVSSIFMQGVCEYHDIPHIVVRRDTRGDHDPARTINLYPDTRTLSNVYVQMIRRMKWESFSILYEDTDSLLVLQDVLKMYKPFTHEIRAFKLGTGPNFSEPLLNAKFSPHKSFLLDCAYDSLHDVLKQAQELGMMSEAYRWLVTSLDLQLIDSWPFRYTGANVSGLRLVDPDDPFVSSFVGARLDDFGLDAVDKLRLDDALMFDAVTLFAQGYKDFVYANPVRRANRLPNVKDQPDRSAWPHGLSLRNYVKYNTLNGLSGPVTIDPDGVRRRFKLDVLNLRHTGFTKVGTWYPESGFDDLLVLANEKTIDHLKILITMNPPFAKKVNHSESVQGNARYEGFVIDIIKKVAEKLHFNYTFYVQDDADNGNCTKNPKTERCTCTGMMGKLLRNEMDMAITDLTITENRAACIQFSTAFWNLGMTILYKKPGKAAPTWYSFLLPFSSEIWMYLGLVWVLMSVLFYVFARLSPGEWTNPYPCVDEPSHLENQYTIDSAFWFTIGTLLQQGTELAPAGISTRCLAGWWWFFCLIITNSYTANLAAFLTNETPQKTIKSINDLVNQTKIAFGAKKGGSTFTYFASSSDPRHQALYEQMIDPEWSAKWMVDKNEIGIELARKEDVNYAFLGESPTIEYTQHRICNLQMVGGLIDQKAYAIGYANDFKYTKNVDRAIAELNENTVIKGLYTKWWTEKGAVCVDNPAASAESMTLAQLVGVFYLAGVGSMVALVLTSYEFLLGVRATSKADGVKFMDTFRAEVKFISGSKSIKTLMRKKKSLATNCSDNNSCNLTMTTQT